MWCHLSTEIDPKHFIMSESEAEFVPLTKLMEEVLADKIVWHCQRAIDRCPLYVHYPEFHYPEFGRFVTWSASSRHRHSATSIPLLVTICSPSSTVVFEQLVQFGLSSFHVVLPQPFTYAAPLTQVYEQPHMAYAFRPHVLRQNRWCPSNLSQR